MTRRFRRPKLPRSIIMPSRGRRSVPTLVAVVALVAWYWARSSDQTAPATSDPKRYHDRSFRVVRVVDGDTLDIDAPDGPKSSTRIRLWGVDTPEIGHGRDPPMYFGPQAYEFAERTLQGRTVHIVLSPTRTRDKFGRLLAYVHLDRGGPMFNELLLEQGYAYADLRFDHLYDDRFESLEKRARKSGLGLWHGVTAGQMPAWRQRIDAGRGQASGKP